MNLREQANQATLAEAAKIVGVNAEAARKAIKRGVLRARRQAMRRSPGFRYVVDLEDVEVWKATRKPALESADKHELARIRGIQLRSAERAITRARGK